MIYVLSIDDGKFIKIGFTSKPVAERVAQLQTGNPLQIKLLFAVEGTLRQEKEIHRTLKKSFRRCNIPLSGNEWYPGRNTMFSGFLEEFRYGCNAGLAFLDQYDPANKQYSKKFGETKPNALWENRARSEKFRQFGREREAELGRLREEQRKLYDSIMREVSTAQSPS